MNKYHARKIEYDGIVFDSKKEMHRYLELKILEKSGEITDLKRQVKFVLIPEQREISNEVYTKGPKKGQAKPGKVIEKECAYYADFCYKYGTNYVVEDVKGILTKDFIIKRKLMLSVYGIRISIV